MASVAYTVAKLIALFASLTAAILATAAAKARWETAVKDEDALTAELAPLLAAVRAIVYEMYSNAPDTLEDFGLAVHKVAHESLAVKVAAAAKAKATRLARHTMGKGPEEGDHGGHAGPRGAGFPEPVAATGTARTTS